MLDGRRIVVTGGSSGIGRALTIAYAAAGARVWTVARRESELAATVAACPPGRAIPVVADLLTESGRRAVSTAVEHAGGALDVAVHAAGALGPIGVPLAAYPEDAWNAVFAANVTSVHLLHQRLAPMLDAGHVPTVIGVASTVGRVARGGWGMYSVSKFALEGWLAVLADEWDGRVYSVNPGGTRTPMRAEARPDEDPASVPEPGRVAPLFLHLAHPGATEPTGSVLEARDWFDRDPWEGIETPQDGAV